MRDTRDGQEADGNREDADRNIDVEDPAPAEIVGEVATDGRSDDGGEAEDPAEDALQLGTLRGRVEVTDGGEDAREEDPSEHALQGTEADELGHVLGLSAQCGRQDEADHAAQEERLSAEEVAELARDRGQRRRAHEVAGRDPGVEVEPVQLRDDPRQRGSDDRLIERGKEQREADTDGGEDACPAGHVTGHWRSPWRWLRSRLEGRTARRGGANASPPEGARARERRAPSCTRDSGPARVGHAP